jgi:hypothetical protein
MGVTIPCKGYGAGDGPPGLIAWHRLCRGKPVPPGDEVLQQDITGAGKTEIMAVGKVSREFTDFLPADENSGGNSAKILDRAGGRYGTLGFRKKPACSPRPFSKCGCNFGKELLKS